MVSRWFISMEGLPESILMSLPLAIWERNQALYQWLVDTFCLLGLMPTSNSMTLIYR